MDPFVREAVETYAQTGKARRTLWGNALAKAVKQSGEI